MDRKQRPIFCATRVMKIYNPLSNGRGRIACVLMPIYMHNYGMFCKAIKMYFCVNILNRENRIKTGLYWLFVPQLTVARSAI